MNRRGFLQRAAVLPLAAAAAVPRPAPPTSHLKLSCNLYSFNAPLRSGAMTLEEVIRFCSDLGFDAVDPTGYYFPGYPATPDDAYVYRTKRDAFVQGLAISGTGVRNDFTDPDVDVRRAGLAHILDWVPVAQKLGAPALRVFAGHHEPEARARDEVRGWIVEGLRAATAFAGDHGVMIALQNHAGFVKTADEIDRIFDAVASPWLGLNLDVGSFRTADPYADIAQAVRHAVTWQIKEHVTVDGRVVPTDLDRLFDVILSAGYRGYLPLETLGEGDPREKLPRFLDEVRAALARVG